MLGHGKGNCIIVNGNRSISGESMTHMLLEREPTPGWNIDGRHLALGPCHRATTADTYRNVIRGGARQHRLDEVDNVFP